MKLYHYSQFKVKEMASTPQNKVPLKNGPIGKPVGLWLSVGDAWEEWCKQEEFMHHSLRFKHEVVLDDKANILYLTNATEIDKFTDDYEDTRKGSVNNHLQHSTMDINWYEVSKKFQGIIIAPYIWSRRLTPRTTWYYGWDCASGCIWDKEAVKSIKFLEEVKI